MTGRTINSVKKIVVDSSVIVKWVNSQDEMHIARADALLEDCRNGNVALFAPELAKYEVGNALWKKGMTSEQAIISLGTVYAGPITFVELDESDALLVMDIASAFRMTYYDASFVRLAERLGATLVTDNPKHQGRYKKIKTVPLAGYGS